MSDGTKIQWTEATWSPVTGCTKISDGCVNCYIERTPPFRMAHRRFSLPVIGGTTGVKLHSDRLPVPIRWRKPRRIFVCSLADLFHDEVPTRFIAEVFAVMSLAPQHTFQVLTKRHARLRSVLNSDEFRAMVDGARMARGHQPLPGDGPVVLDHVWIGVSAESQQWANARIPALLATPAAVRWVSAEPLIGPIAMRPEWTAGLDWLVAGAESGPGSRPCDPDWIRSLIDQCRAGRTVPFVKQLGSVWARDTFVGGRPVSATDPKGGDWDFWDASLRVREYPADRAAVPA